MNQLNIHDIKSLQTIPDYSLWILLALAAVGLIILLASIFFIIKYFKNKNSQRKQALLLLKNLDLNNSKTAAYTITKLAKVLISSQREQKLYEELIEHLNKYKYKKEVDCFDVQTQQKYKIFMDAIDVK